MVTLEWRSTSEFWLPSALRKSTTGTQISFASTGRTMFNWRSCLRFLKCSRMSFHIILALVGGWRYGRGFTYLLKINPSIHYKKKRRSSSVLDYDVDREAIPNGLDGLEGLQGEVEEDRQRPGVVEGGRGQLRLVSCGRQGSLGKQK